MNLLQNSKPSDFLLIQNQEIQTISDSHRISFTSKQIFDKTTQKIQGKQKLMKNSDKRTTKTK